METESLAFGRPFESSTNRSNVMPKVKIERRVKDLEQITKDHDERIAEHDHLIEKLSGDIEELKTDIKLSAKASDITDLRAHIDKETITLLKDALAAVPQKAMVVWTAILAGIAALALFLPWIFKHFGL